MKKGTSQTTIYRYRALWKAYQTVLRRPDILTHEQAIIAAINTPTPRFLISEDKMKRAISRLNKGLQPQAYATGPYHEALTTIYTSFKELKNMPPFCKMTPAFVASYIINSPAPKLYISPEMARKAIAKIKKLRRKYKDEWSEHL